MEDSLKHHKLETFRYPAKVRKEKRAEDTKLLLQE